ncbi:MAG TPA: DUF1152 domain-containing protein, partial [Aggregatilineales bacterium]|nr:DUF1152 domain-containing protein [Aggregatilineales bacterium]
RHIASYPEGFLAQWFSEEYGEDVTVWMFPNQGVQPVRQAYEKLIQYLNIDALILVDGGVDSIMRGDEEAPGTLIEDSISLAAVAPLDIPVKILACIGFGTEVEEMLCHHHALENIAGLAKAGGFIGSCALTPQMESFQFFEQGCRYVWEQPEHGKSHISTRIIPAVHGEFGDFHMYPDDTRHRYINLFISPLMSLYWFFDANVVIQRNLLMNALEDTYIKQEAFTRYVMLKRTMRTRPRRDIPY